MCSSESIQLTSIDTERSAGIEVAFGCDPATLTAEVEGGRHRVQHPTRGNDEGLKQQVT